MASLRGLDLASVDASFILPPSSFLLHPSSSSFPALRFLRLPLLADADDADGRFAVAAFDGMAGEHDGERSGFDGAADEGRLHGGFKAVVALLNFARERHPFHAPGHGEL